MVLTIIIAFISLIVLIILHELGHFVLAKKFGVKVEEFGIGYPPRIFGKKIGQTIYSLNLLPFGAFVKIYGEEKSIEDYQSFSQKPIWQRALIVLGGVVSFWIVSAILLSIVMGLGFPTVISDNENGNLKNPKIQIVAVAVNSPAEKAGLRVGDTIIKIKNQKSKIKNFDKVKELQEFTEVHKGEEMTLTIERLQPSHRPPTEGGPLGKEIFETTLVPRVSPPEGEGAMGVALARTAIKSYPWYLTPWQGILASGNLTIAVIQGWTQALVNFFRGLPTGAQLMGPVGIFSLFSQVSQLGVNYFLQFIAVISVHLALINILPIPALDGGKLLFLGIEAVRKKPLSQAVEQKITTLFFTLLIILMIWVTIKDIARLF